MKTTKNLNFLNCISAKSIIIISFIILIIGAIFIKSMTVFVVLYGAVFGTIFIIGCLKGGRRFILSFLYFYASISLAGLIKMLLS